MLSMIYSPVLILWISAVAVSQEPEVQRNGGVRWDDLSVARRSTGQENDYGSVILHKSTGKVPNGHVCGIIGPSGSGM